MKKADLCSVFILLFVLSAIVAIVLAESFEQTTSIPAGTTRSVALQLSWGGYCERRNFCVRWHSPLRR